MEAHFLCWNGPCAGQLVTDCPVDATVGTACAIPWTNTKGKPRYAVYILLEQPDGAKGLVFEKSHETRMGAQRRVEYLTFVVRQHMGAELTN